MLTNADINDLPHQAWLRLPFVSLEPKLTATPRQCRPYYWVGSTDLSSRMAGQNLDLKGSKAINRRDSEERGGKKRRRRKLKGGENVEMNVKMLCFVVVTLRHLPLRRGKVIFWGRDVSLQLPIEKKVLEVKVIRARFKN